MILKNSRPYFYLLNKLKWPLLILAAMSIFVGEFDDNVYLLQDFSLAVPAFLGTAIVISLAFRTNKAYMRWWEAKMIWEGVVNATRSWVRMILEFMPGDPESGDSSGTRSALTEKLVNRQIAWNYVLTARLREEDPLQGMERYLEPDDLEFLAGIDNATQGLLFLQSRDLKKAFDQGQLPIYLHIELEETLRMLEAYMGKAERIKKTHFPVLYDMIIESSVYVFCLVMAYFIDDPYTFFEAGISFLLSGLFLALNSIAREMQDPFENSPSDTPMTTISNDLERSALQIMRVTEVPEPVRPNAFFLS